MLVEGIDTAATIPNPTHKIAREAVMIVKGELIGLDSHPCWVQDRQHGFGCLRRCWRYTQKASKHQPLRTIQRRRQGFHILKINSHKIHKYIFLIMQAMVQ